ncbi:MAG: AIM24 family protein [Ruminococcus sp.]|nr:AIM24 family protein [Ruminococcus sp.]
MKYKIIGQTVPAVECELACGESMFTQSGGMIWHTDGITMSTESCSFGRIFTGESVFMTNYTARRRGTIAFGATVPGSIVPVDVSRSSVICQKGAFLCAEQTVNLKVEFTKRFYTGLFGGEGFILQRIYGRRGMAFLEVDGDAIERNLSDGEVIKVSNGNVVAFDTSVKYEIEAVRGIKNTLFSGEGFYLARLVGPGRVIIQTQNFNDFSNKIISKIPSDK